MAGEWRRTTKPGETVFISMGPGEYNAMCAEKAAENEKGEGITDEDRGALREYLSKRRELEEQAPEPLTDDDMNAIMKHVNECGEVPAEYRDRVISVDMGDGEKGVYSYAEYEHFAKVSMLEEAYHGVLAKVLPTMTVKVERDAENGVEYEFRQVIPSIDPDTEELAAYPTDKLIELAISSGRQARPRDRAIEKGALMSMGGRVAAFTLEELKCTLTGDSIMRLPIGTNAGDVFDDAGRLNTLAVRESELETLTEYHAAFLMSVLGMVEAASIYDDEEDSKIEFYLPSIMDEIGIDPRPYSKKRDKGENAPKLEDMRFTSMLELISPFELYAGRMPDGSGIYRVLSFSGYDAESQTMTIDTPYLFKLKRYAETIKNGGKPVIHRYLHGNVANEPNQAAVELASRIAGGLARRGTRGYEQAPVKKKTRTKTKPDGTKETVVTEYEIDDLQENTKDRVIPYEVKYSTLIADCPILRGELEAIENDPERKHKAQAYNSKLKQVFEAAFRIIETKSDIPQKFTDLKLPTVEKVVTVKRKGESVKERRRCYVVPTRSTLSRKLVITFTGKVRNKTTS